MPPATTAAPLRLLLVEDHDLTRNMIAHALSLRGFSVVSVAGMTEARKQVSAETFNLVIADIDLEDGTGTELMAWLKGEFPRLPGVAITGKNSERDTTTILSSGFSAHFVKPVEIATLVKAVAAFAR